MPGFSVWRRKYICSSCKLFDKPSSQMREHLPSIFVLWCFQLYRAPVASLEQILSTRAVEVAITHCVRPDDVIKTYFTSAFVCPES